jgi:hypothetical protein
VVIHFATELTGPWLFVIGFVVFCLLSAGTLAWWAHKQAPVRSKTSGRRAMSTDLSYPPISRAPGNEDPSKTDADPPSPVPTGPLAALEKLYTEGDGMLKAGNPLAAIGLGGHGPAPTEAAVEDWKKRVLATLPQQYRGGFQVASIKAKSTHALLMTAVYPLESEHVSRLRPHLLKLEEIIGKMAYP